jgi:hypothetical protein
MSVSAILRRLQTHFVCLGGEYIVPLGKVCVVFPDGVYRYSPIMPSFVCSQFEVCPAGTRISNRTPRVPLQLGDHITVTQERTRLRQLVIKNECGRPKVMAVYELPPPDRVVYSSTKLVVSIDPRWE